MSEKSLEQKSVTNSGSKFSCEIVLDFQKTNCFEVEQATSSNFRDK